MTTLINILIPAGALGIYSALPLGVFRHRSRSGLNRAFIPTCPR